MINIKTTATPDLFHSAINAWLLKREQDEAAQARPYAYVNGTRIFSVTAVKVVSRSASSRHVTVHFTYPAH